MVVMSDEQAQIRDTVMTTRGFLLRGIQAAAGNIPNEREAWKVYEGMLTDLEVSEVEVGLHHVQYILSDGYSFVAERLDRGDGIDRE